MASFEFLCPHCSERFELANPPPGGQANCPRCGRAVAIPSELPEQVSPAIDVPAPPTPEPRPAAVEPPPVVFDAEAMSLELGVRQSRPTEPAEDLPRIEPLSREEKERRRQVRNLVWMIGGVVLLAIAALVLSRL
jgi:hypothetical protein